MILFILDGITGLDGITVGINKQELLVLYIESTHKAIKVQSNAIFIFMEHKTRKQAPSNQQDHPSNHQHHSSTAAVSAETSMTHFPFWGGNVNI